MRLRMKCPNCGHWNRITVEKVLFNPDSPEPKVQVFAVIFTTERREML